MLSQECMKRKHGNKKTDGEKTEEGIEVENDISQKERLLEIWIRFFPQKTVKLRDILFQEYRWLSYSIATNYIAKKMPYRSLLDPEDIRQHADIGLLEAIGSFDPYRGVAFETFAYTRIKGSIIDGIRILQNFPSIIASIKRRLEPLIQALTQELQRTPSVEEIITRFPRFNINGINIRRLLRNPLVSCNVFNQQSEGGTGESSSETVLDFCLNKNNKNKPEEVSKNLQRIDLIDKIINCLTDENKERTIIYLYYFFGMTTGQISAVVKLSNSCVSFRKIVAIRKLKREVIFNKEFADLLYSILT